MRASGSSPSTRGEFKREKASEFGATHSGETVEVAEKPSRSSELTWGQMADKVIMTPGVMEVVSSWARP